MKWRKFKETFKVDKSKLGLNYEKLLSLLTKHTFPPRSGQVQISDLGYFCQKKILYSLELKKSKLGIKYEKLLTTKNFFSPRNGQVQWLPGCCVWSAGHKLDTLLISSRPLRRIYWIICKTSHATMLLKVLTTLVREGEVERILLKVILSVGDC